MSEKIDDNLMLLNSKKAITDLGDAELYNMMLAGIEDTTLRPNLAKLKNAMDVFDYKEIRMTSHTLKGSIAYIGGERAKRASEIVQFNVDKQQGPEIFKNYPLIIEECIKLKREIRRYSVMNKLENSPSEFKENDADFDVPICKFYKLKKESATNFKIVQEIFPTIPPVPFLDITGKKPIAQVNKPEEKSASQAKEAQGLNNGGQNQGNSKMSTSVQVTNEIKKPETENKNTKPENKETTKVTAAEVKKEDKKDPVKAQDEQEPKEKKETTGCSCSLL